MNLFLRIILSLIMIGSLSACSNQDWASDTQNTPTAEAVKDSEAKLNNETLTKKDPVEKVANDSWKELKLATCLKEKWAKLYWTSWCSHCKRQKEMLWPEAVKALWFIDCDQNKSACTAAWVKGYPTWVINWENLPWVRELNFVASKAGCTY